VGVNMLVGDVKQFTAVDELGRPRTDATWTVDNTTLGTITTDSSPILTALATGTVTLTATVQGVTAQTQVNISALTVFLDGTILWTAPPVPGFSPQGIAQAMPSSFGPAFYSIEKSSDGTQSLVQAFTSAGQLLWQTTLPALVGKPVPDAFGGVVLMEGCNTSDPVNNPLAIVDLDGGTGTVLWQGAVAQSSGQLNVCLAGLPKLAIRPDGGVVVSMPLQISPAMVVLDGSTGRTILTPPIPPSTFTSAVGQVSSCDCFTPVGQPIVDSDGSVYVEYFAQNDLQFYPTRGVLWLLKIAPDGSTSTTQLSSYDAGHLWPGQVIPDGQGGILATWAIDNTFPPGAYHPYQAAEVTSGVAAAPYDMPMAPQNLLRDSNTGIPLELPLVLGENGTAFVSYGSNVTSFNLPSGSTNWNYQNPQGIGSMLYTNGGGLTLIDGQSNEIPLDSGGNASTSVALPTFSLLQASLTGDWQAAIPSSSVGLAGISLQSFAWGHSFWAAIAGGPVPTNTSKEVPYVALLPSCSTGCAQEIVENAVNSLKTLVSGNCTACNTNVFSKSQLGITKDSYTAYLNRAHKFYDITNSHAPAGEVLCTDHWIFNFFAPTCSLNMIDFKKPINQYWADLGSPGALTKTPSASGEGLVTFFDPAQVCNTTGVTDATCKSLSATDGGKLNQATVFHESLHGETGLFDNSLIGGQVTLESVFGICYQTSFAITEYLNYFIWGVGPAPTYNNGCSVWPTGH